MRSPRPSGTFALAVVVLCSAGCRQPHVAIAEPPEGTPVTIDTPAGTLLGIEANGLRYFLGVPYAAPPVGSLRFRAPERLPRASVAMDATTYGAACPQLVGHKSGEPVPDDAPVEGSEDCLTLNVVTHTGGAPRPVMVFVHGGGFLQGNGSKPDYEATRLATEGDIVVVTFNYRLGALGFHASEEIVGEATDGSAGNQGILDQIAALRWVQDNIGVLGGDPTRVTIFGESAGATSVCVLVASPLAIGLFRGAIVESSGGCADLPSLREPGALAPAIERGQWVASAVGCADGALGCMREVPAAALVRGGARVMQEQEGLQLFYAPTLDGVVLSETPFDRFAAGEADVPMVIGSNEDESNAFLLRTDVADDAEYAAYLSQLFGADADAVRAVYPASSLGSPTETLRRAVTEARFLCPSLSLAEAASGGAPAFAYYFTHHRDGRLASALGAFHGIEMGYLFGTFSDEFHADDADRAVGQRMRMAWSGFARTGTPAATPAWPAFDRASASLYRIDREGSVIADPSDGRCAQLEAAGVVRAAP